MTTLTEFNADDALAAEVLGACLDIPEWVTGVCARRPFGDLDALRAVGAAQAAVITWPQVAGALDRHPRIGEKEATVAGSATESAWSKSEQAGVQDEQGTALAAGNAAYEARFGYIFLVCAAGLSGDAILENLKTRLTNDAESEKTVVMEELRKIAVLRLAKAVSS